ncbi:putative morphogenesis protein [Eutypa lata UCREL1]|uniref:Putative morphogenesis protein n=1 Tax=Eutypa lata (strain UCR-EL1) TaxID=1287681 RepID=M7SXI3_EUTLA|nr:putative morphogenesis protein [Eutypa lata UCREL1]
MPSIFSRIRSKDGKKSKKANLESLSHQLPNKPRWDDAYTRSSVEPEEIQELVRRCTEELKARGLDIPFLLLPFRPTSDPSAVRNFVRHFFDHETHNLSGEALAQELRMAEPMPRSQIIFDFFDILSAVAAHGKVNGFGGRKLSRMAAWWAFEHKDTGNGLEGGYKNWLNAADATSHLFFAYLRSLAPTQTRSGISMLPMSLQKLLQETEYPPQVPVLMQSSTYKVVMIVDSVSPTPFALLRRANRFQYRDDDRALQEFSEYEDPVKALTEECRRVLKAISLANDSQVSSSKHSTSLRDASWSRFEDIGFSGTLEEEDEDNDPVKQLRESHRMGLRTTPQSAGQFGRPTTPSWADFLSSGFVNDAPNSPTNLLLPPDKVLPPIETNFRQRSSQSHRPRLEGEVHLEPGELASINRFDLDDAFWWVWMSSLAPEEPIERKAAFGRCAIIETMIRAGRWLVMEEMVKGAAPEPDSGAYIAEKKGLFSWTRRNKGVSRSKSVAAKRGPNQDNMGGKAGGPGASKTSIAPDQQAKIQKAAQQLQAKENQERLVATSLPERRGRTDSELMMEKTNSVLTLQPVIMSEASPAMKWANHYDKQSIRQAYLSNSQAGRGGDEQTNVQTNGHTGTNGTKANGSKKPEVPEKLLSPITQSPAPTIPQSPATEERALSPEKRLEAPEDIHPAERPVPTGRNSPLPPTPREHDSTEVARESVATPEPGLSPDSKKHKKLHKDEKKTGGGFRKFFGRKNRQSKLPENAASNVNAMLAQEKTQPEPPAEPSAPAPERPAPVASESAVKSPTESDFATPAERFEDITPTQPQAPPSGPEPTYAPSAEEHLSRVDTADAAEANREFSRFDQGPLSDQPAFIPDDGETDDEDDDDAAPPPIARHASHNHPADAEPRPSEESSAPSPAVPMQDRWAAIRRNAADRHARQSEEQSRGGYSKTTDEDDNTSGEETIESRVARIKARVAELTGNMEGNGPPPGGRR